MEIKSFQNILLFVLNDIVPFDLHFIKRVIKFHYM